MQPPAPPTASQPLSPRAPVTISHRHRPRRATGRVRHLRDSPAPYCPSWPRCQCAPANRRYWHPRLSTTSFRPPRPQLPMRYEHIPAAANTTLPSASLLPSSRPPAPACLSFPDLRDLAAAPHLCPASADHAAGETASSKLIKHQKVSLSAFRKREPKLPKPPAALPIGPAPCLPHSMSAPRGFVSGLGLAPDRAPYWPRRARDLPQRGERLLRPAAR